MYREDHFIPCQIGELCWSAVGGGHHVDKSLCFLTCNAASSITFHTE